jgi:predicted RNA binding protein YcfA (HicA-like mRNA interferase family)
LYLYGMAKRSQYSRKVAMKQALSFRLGWFESRFSGSRRRMEEARQLSYRQVVLTHPCRIKEKGEAAAARKLIQELTCGTNRCMSRFHRQCRKASVTAGSSVKLWSVPLLTESCWLPPPTEFWSVPCNEPCKLPICSFPITAIFRSGMNYGSD